MADERSSGTTGNLPIGKKQVPYRRRSNHTSSGQMFTSQMPYPDLYAERWVR